MIAFLPASESHSAPIIVYTFSVVGALRYVLEMSAPSTLILFRAAIKSAICTDSRVITLAYVSTDGGSVNGYQLPSGSSS
jgi:hypothetical protein